MRSVALIGLVLILSPLVAPHTAFAQRRPNDGERDHLSGIAEFGLGLLTLPSANVCTDRTTYFCKKGDSSLMIDGWTLVRISRAFTTGAGITLGLLPTTDAPVNEAPGIERDHSRSYFMAEGLVRFYPFSTSTWQGWVGATSGLVVVADTYSSTAGQPTRSLVGPRGVTTRTEGFAAGLALGIDRPIIGNWSVGGLARYGFWFLPDQAATNPFGDEASLTGRNAVIVLGLTIGYRIRVY